MNRKIKIITILIVILLFCSVSLSQNSFNDGHKFKPLKWNYGLRLSTFGIGIDVDYKLSKKVHVRTGISYLKFNYPINNFRDDLDGSVKVTPTGIPVIADYWIFNNVFLSGGTILNFSRISISGTPSESVWIGDIEMLPNEIGKINAKLKPGMFISPYIGTGFGFSNIKSSKYSLKFDVGALFHGKPKVNLGATGMLSPTASDAQEKLIEQNISQLSIYPIMSFIVYYDFL